MRKVLCLSIALTATVGLAVPTMADAVSDFYKGKRVNVIVGFSPGGGYDAYGRLFARHIPKHIPGKPNVIVQNMPGASSMKAVKYLTATAPQDGTVTTIFNPGLIAQSLSTPDKIDIDFSTLRFIGSATSDVRVCYFWHETGIKSMEDLLKRDQVVMGATAIGSNSYINGALLRNMFGAKIKHVSGYPGSAEQRIAIERGELQGDCGAWGSIPANWLKDGKAVPIVRFSKAEVDGMPKLPYIMDLAKSKEQRQILNLVLSSAEIGRPFAVGPKVPDDRLTALRSAFDKMIKDKDFVTEADKSRREIIGPMSGAEVEAMIKEIYATPKNIVSKVGGMTK